MPDIKISEAQKEEIQKEIKFIKSSETGKLYLDKKFKGKDPAAVEYLVEASSLYQFIKWLLKPDKGRDGKLKSLIQHGSGHPKDSDAPGFYGSRPVLR